MSAPQPSPWLSGAQPSATARFRLFCLPFAGGGASAYKSWLPELPAEVELCRVQLPGRESRFAEPPATSIDELLPQLHEALRPWLDRPFALFGHSMGAMLTFELSRRLRDAGDPMPALLLPSGHRGPHLPLRRRRWAELPHDELIAELRAINGIPAEILAHDELLKLLLPVVRADLGLYERYEHTEAPPLPCPIAAFAGESDQIVTVEEAQGWSRHTSAECRVHVIPGGHFFLFEAPAQMGARIADELRSVRALDG